MSNYEAAKQKRNEAKKLLISKNPVVRNVAKRRYKLAQQEIKGIFRKK